MNLLGNAASGLVIFIYLTSPTNSYAFFEGVPIIGDAEREIKKGGEDIIKNGGNIIGKGITEIGNGIKDVTKEGEKTIKKTFKEIGNAAEDIRILVEEGKCGGDICVALTATADFVEASIQDTGKAVEDAGKRLSEGKPLDAMWHLSIAPYDIQQENAAKAAMKSSVLRAVGQAAATAYGGPQGAAAYAAWLTYHQTGGNLELALKAGAIAGATSYAMSAISKDVEFVDVAKDIKVDEILQRAVMTGAISGTAVALSGGDEEQIKQAFTAGALTSVIRDGYKELTKSNLEDNMKASTGAAYCLKANPNAESAPGQRLGCLPEPGAYVAKDGNSIQFRDDGTIDEASIEHDPRSGNPKIDMTKLDSQRPHVGTWSSVANEGPLGAGETSGFMTGISRIPGMNGMAVAHDIFDDRYNTSTNIVLETAIRVGTIAPFVVMTYEGAGLSVQESIRNAIAKPRGGNEAVVVATPNEPSQGITVSGKDVSEAQQGKAPDSSVPVEIRHLYCKRDHSPAKNILMEIDLKREQPKKYSERVCRIDQYLGGDHWASIWHAHYQKSFCINKFNDMAIRYVQRDFTCYTNLGVRFDPTTSTAPPVIP
ncbi:hypothetical protein [Rhizobium leguminosarum]|uniref:hypothetical protein n=1 Tax=Rhizobium leguminosarum TaxID=384 RepID=UPI00102FC216|nr:hypothetical protein [Rhizobium leguminosarum]TAY69174.1 hypothetical protein ELH82_24780 [Rhizobium leguminosarum]